MLRDSCPQSLAQRLVVTEELDFVYIHLSCWYVLCNIGWEPGIRTNTQQSSCAVGRTTKTKWDNEPALTQHPYRPSAHQQSTAYLGGRAPSPGALSPGVERGAAPRDMGVAVSGRLDHH